MSGAAAHDLIPAPRAVETRCYIGGEFVRGDAAPVVVVNPATDLPLAEIAGASPSLAARAADLNAHAAREMRALPILKRVELVRRLAAGVRNEAPHLAALLTAESGKPIVESRGEVEYAASFFDNAAAAAEMAAGELPASRTADRRVLVLREPVGATFAITPWNFPLAMIARKLAPALAAGCSQAVKPAEETPLSALAFARIFDRVVREVGAPTGAFSVVVGEPPQVAAAFITHPGTRKLTFTGSTEVGRVLAAQCAPRLLRTALELGGNAPFIVFADADIDRAADQAMLSKFRFMGQTCICANRFLLEASIAEEFLARLEARVKALAAAIGDPTLESTRMGPLINDAAIAKVERHVADAVARGARVRFGGTRARIAGLADRFHAPTILEGCDPTMACACEETFGPVVAAMTFRSEAEALAMANGVPYGLAGYVMTQDADRLLRVAEGLEFGVVGANDGAPSTAEAPFGGRKDSGLGKEGGGHGLDAYTELKYVSLRVRAGS
ncbi:MAG: aldehyde dehydrogenase family protein [Planctomycetaceae bacterium]|nr:aldehyde dehydrogenase family protein [Planctomycetaceae bacterium]